MSIDVWSGAVDIERPPDTVTRYAFDPDNDPAWIGGIRTARLETERPVQVGSRVRRLATFLGRRIPYVMEVTELVPGRRMAMHAIESPFPMDVTYEFEPAGSRRTRARIRVAGSPAGYIRLAAPLVPWMVRRSVTADLRRLKQRVEAQPPEG